ncbi:MULTISPECIES: AAA family ATPase [Clostridia]|nr:AAA family ATPase [Hungatella hathewayi]RGY94920.1 ATP-binding protein [Hungatella hathewayi]
MILVTSPPACGKTYISKQLAKNLKHVVYLDKDTLIVLSNRIFDVAGEERNRSSDFFESNIRNFEYEAIINIAMEALDYDDIVLINAPFTREIRSPEYMDQFRKRLASKNARLEIIWVVTDPEICHQRMIRRNSSRDTWKLENWDQYISGVDFSIPSAIDRPDSSEDDLLLFYNSTDQEYQESMKRIVGILEEDC